MILSSNMLALLCRQYSHETRNSLVYSVLESWADMRGLNGSAAFLRKQAQGERSHADMVLDYIRDRNAQLALEQIELIPVNPTGFVDVFAIVQQVERETTDRIAEINDQAAVERDMATQAWLARPSGLIPEQVEEESVVQTILDRIEIRNINATEMGAAVHDIDVWIGELTESN